ncbi:unnamed protein product [Linum tenue]|uniref:NAD-dependent epimerase/dehydratase domain-containing protein n=1 Tax=Linum tenue TaxID=586396 RepID=A0AAV0HLV9_9ROSI|nr:unnamed protein product [Linum tenue]
MQAVSRRLGHRYLKPAASPSPIDLLFPLADYGVEHPRYISTITPKGVGHLVRKGTSVLREIPEATVLRPATMIGTEDRMLNTWAHFAKKYSFVPLFGDGSTKFQPVYVVDVAAAVVAALKDDGTSMGKIYELGGPEIFTMHELAEVMFETIREWPRYVKIPLPVAKAAAMPREILLNKVPFPLPTPSIFNLDKINAISTDTLVSENALTFLDLGIEPHKLRGYPIEFLLSYRKGGPQLGSTVSEGVSPDSLP